MHRSSQKSVEAHPGRTVPFPNLPRLGYPRLPKCVSTSLEGQRPMIWAALFQNLAPLGSCGLVARGFPAPGLTLSRELGEAARQQKPQVSS